MNRLKFIDGRLTSSPYKAMFMIAVLLAVCLSIWGMHQLRAQNSDEAHVEFTSIKPGVSGAIIHRAAEPLAVNYNGNLIDAVGRYLLTLWDDPPEYQITLRVVDSIAPDTMQVRVRSRYVREKTAPPYRLNYIDTLVSGRRQEFPSARGANTGFPAGSMLIVSQDLSGSTVGDSTVIYLNRYGGVALAQETHRSISYYGAVSSSVSDTGGTLPWAGLRRLTYSIRADDDSCVVRILARIFSGGWGAADYTLDDSTTVSSSLFSQFAMALDSIPPGDSLQVIVVPLTPFGTDPISFGAVARGEF